MTVTRGDTVSRPMTAVLCLLLSAAALPSLVAASEGGSSKCTDQELKTFAQEYESCHARSLHRLKAKTSVLKPTDKDWAR